MKYRSDIQGLRALAVLLVIAHHYFPEEVTGGFLGVDIFFVISGFIITSVLSESSKVSLSTFLNNFYARRIRRILPSALLVIIMSTGFAFMFLGSITGSDTARDGIFASIFAANIHFNSSALDYFAAGLPQPILQHYWSLAIEEQFYLLWPVIFFLSRKSSTRLVVVLGLSITSIIYAFIELSQGSTTVYLSTYSRIWELGLGAALAISRVFVASRLMSYVSLTGLVVLSFIYTPESDFPGLSALTIAVLTCGVLLNSDSNPVLNSKAMTWIGDRSYTLYLAHWPIFQIASLFRGTELLVSEKVMLLAFMMIVSTVIFRFFEDPLRRSELLIRDSSRTIIMGVGASIITVIGLASIGSLI